MGRRSIALTLVLAAIGGGNLVQQGTKKPRTMPGLLSC
jgi:hypothetical protein